MVVANATGCSSIYGGNLPTTPWSKNKAGRGPAWSNSLFEDNAEFGLGYRVSIDQQQLMAKRLLQQLQETIGSDLVEALLSNPQEEEADITQQRILVDQLKTILAKDASSEARRLEDLADTLVKRSVWIVGGDGWAYDIGYGGLDHVLASGRDVNILVMDTEVYSNTGGQCSKATPLGAVAKFAMAGKQRPKKDLAAQAMTYGSVYVARIAMGADDTQTIKAIVEAERFKGPSLIIAYSHCIAHGYDLKHGLEQQTKAVQSGYWPLYRYHPDRVFDGKNPLMIDSKAPSISFNEYALAEMRYQILTKTDPKRSHALLAQAKTDIDRHWEWLKDVQKHYEPRQPEPLPSSSTD
jgi:pyruvate-ferredoxin/flavodoxin oxidoreductase